MNINEKRIDVGNHRKGPSLVNYVEGDLLDCGAQYIAHQCNCVMRGQNVGGGLYASMIKKFPLSNVYAEAERSKIIKPGSIIIRRGYPHPSKIICMFSQKYPGRSSYDGDTVEMRLNWFRNCLDLISTIKDLEQIAFPHMVGCGLAGGNWDRYEELICEFAAENTHVNVCIYKLPPKERMTIKS